ncbi:MAG: hypothetical protein A4E57_04816 [Syntrophorhabdaceae bacterium PtaU1.Bin034]|nr:MAG: hypothetical protein A4E57_04816 [Syntrophorhabdaceae bacterium PtaU1.Bin034]
METVLHRHLGQLRWCSPVYLHVALRPHGKSRRRHESLQGIEFSITITYQAHLGHYHLFHPDHYGRIVRPRRDADPRQIHRGRSGSTRVFHIHDRDTAYPCLPEYSLARRGGSEKATRQRVRTEADIQLDRLDIRVFQSLENGNRSQVHERLIRMLSEAGQTHADHVNLSHDTLLVR